jgi:RIO-like serine/threonine protein kinase
MQIEYGELVQRMRVNQLELKKVMVEIAKALTLVNSHGIVHSDLKT